MPQASVSKRGKVQNLSCENYFFIIMQINSFSQERFCTWPGFKSEGFWNSKMANCAQYSNPIFSSLFF